MSRPAGDSSFSPREKRLLALAFSAVIVLGLVGALTKTYSGRLSGWWRGDCDLRGRWRYSPEHPEDAEALGSTDVERLNGLLLPRWTATAARWAPSEDRAYAELVAGIGEDRNLLAIAGELRQIVLERRVIADAERLHYLSWAWSTYHDRAGEPYWIRGGVAVAGGTYPFFYVLAYRTLADADVAVGEQLCRIRVVERLDRSTLWERRLGGVSNAEDGAIIIADRVGELALDVLWPLLAARGRSELHPVAARHVDAVEREIRAGIGPAHGEALRRTASSRAALLDALGGIESRSECNDTQLMSRPPLGYDQHALAGLMGLSGFAEGDPCPWVKPEEAVALAKHSVALQSEPLLEEASGRLQSWLSGLVAVHEARHVADAAGPGIEGLECRACGPPVVTAEVSAYLAAMGWSGAPATCFFQACRAVLHDSEETPHAAAMEVIQQELGHYCEAGTPPALDEHARQLELALFGRGEAVHVPEGFPSLLEPAGGERSEGGRVTAAAERTN